MSSSLHDASAPSPTDIREAALATALARASQQAQAAAATVNITDADVKSQLKAFNLELFAIPDYLHNHPARVLDAIQLLKRVCNDLIEHGGMKPGQPTHPLEIKITSFDRKTHGISHCYFALLRMGFREEVRALEKAAVYHGIFPTAEDHKAVKDRKFLELVAHSLEVTEAGVLKHLQAMDPDQGRRRAQEAARRQRVLEAFDEDRQTFKAKQPSSGAQAAGPPAT